MSGKDSIIREIELLPESDVEKVLEFVSFLKSSHAHGKSSDAILSESSLKKDWLKPEEDIAWQNL